MLILSRRPTEAISFPQLGITVSVVSVNGSRVRVGIDAPSEIKVLRRELEQSSADQTQALLALTEKPESAVLAARAKHNFRNELNKATLGIHLAQKQLAAGLVESADKTLSIALALLAELESAASAERGRSSDSMDFGLSVGVGRKSNTPKRNRTGAESFQSIDVLLVEDDQNEQALLRGLLEMEGYHVYTANNGAEALACLKHITPRFILLDMMMPQCNGRETLERIRQVPAWQHLPVYAVSGSSPQSIGLSIGSDGVDDWFPKPLNAPRLVQHLREHVEGLCV